MSRVSSPSTVAHSGRTSVVCLVTAPQTDARSIASAVIDNKLAACVNIVALVQSLYWWEGKVEQDDEALLVVKTTRAAVSGLEELLRTIHPYDTFELIAFDIVAGSQSYLEWIDKSVGQTH
jgi:periplasmic divalent cation tolerance protein